MNFLLISDLHQMKHSMIGQGGIDILNCLIRIGGLKKNFHRNEVAGASNQSSDTHISQSLIESIRYFVSMNAGLIVSKMLFGNVE